MLKVVLALSIVLCCALAHSAIPELDFKTNEQRIGGRIGVFAIGKKSGERLSYRGEERFLMCSTFKLLLVAQILKRVDNREEKLDRSLHYTAQDLLAYSPIASKHVTQGEMTIRDLSEAAIRYSDNTAANLLLRTQGGPSGLTTFLRSIGDPSTRLDRLEPDLNAAAPGKDLDTTTPSSMAETIQKLILGDSLSATSQKLLKDWLLANTTSVRRFRAGVPKDWKVADKSGTGDDGVTNDAGILYSENGTEIVLTVFTSGSKMPREKIENEIAQIARTVSEKLGAH